jgi:hypothetical protein
MLPLHANTGLGGGTNTSASGGRHDGIVWGAIAIGWIAALLPGRRLDLRGGCVVVKKTLDLPQLHYRSLSLRTRIVL